MNKNREYSTLLVMYQLFIAAPIAITFTIILTTIVIVFAPIFGDRAMSYNVAKIWGRTVCALTFVKVKVSGAENFDPNKSYIFVSNHQSIFDIFVISGWLNSHIKWIMKQEIREMPFIGKACESAGHIFIDRGNAVKAQRSISKAADKIAEGNSIVLFPEGTRTRDGSIGKFKNGAFSIAKNIHLPIVPITIRGAYRVLPSNSLYTQPGTIELIIHEPIDTSGLTGENINEYKQRIEDIIKQGL